MKALHRERSAFSRVLPYGKAVGEVAPEATEGVAACAAGSWSLLALTPVRGAPPSGASRHLPHRCAIGEGPTAGIAFAPSGGVITHFRTVLAYSVMCVLPAALNSSTNCCHWSIDACPVTNCATHER